MNDTAGNRIRERRKDLGISQDELASKLGYGRTWLANIETDKRPLPGADTLLRLCDLLKTTPTYILTGYEESDVTIGRALGFSGRTLKSLKDWKKNCDDDREKHGDDTFPISDQIDFIVSVLANSPLTVMMLYEYLTCDYTRLRIIKGEMDTYSLPINHVFAENGFFSTCGESVEPWARYTLMDQLKELRERLKSRKEDTDGKH